MRSAQLIDLESAASAASAASADEVVVHMPVRLELGTEESARRWDVGVDSKHDADAVVAS